MANELVKVTAAMPGTAGEQAALPVLVERAGGAARFAWDEFFHAEHHNSHIQKAFMRAVKSEGNWRIVT